jgi:hypothetical protein
LWLVWFVCGQALALHGDDCLEPFVLSGMLPITVTGDTANFFPNHDLVVTTGCPLALGGDGPEVVYAYTPPQSYGDVLLSLCHSIHPDTSLYFRTDCDDPSSQIACNEDGCGDSSDFRSRISGLTLVGGVTYYIFVDGYDNVSGYYQLEMTGTPLGLSTPTPLPGDNCLNPLEVTLPFPFEQVLDTTGYRNELDLVNEADCLYGAGGDGPDIVLHLVADQNYCRFWVDMCAIDGLSNPHPDPDLYIRSACDVPSSQIACSEDACAGNRPRIDHLTLLRGDELFIVVDGYGSAAGEVRVKISGLASSGILGDDACNAIVAEVGTPSAAWCFPGSTVGLNDVVAHPGGGGAGAADKLFEVEPVSDFCRLRAEVTWVPGAWQPLVYSALITALGPVWSETVSLEETPGRLVHEVPRARPGELLIFVVDGAAPGEIGDFQFCLSGETTYAEGTCAQPEMLVPGTLDHPWDGGVRSLFCAPDVIYPVCGAAVRSYVFALPAPLLDVRRTFSLDHPETSGPTVLEVRNACTDPGSVRVCAKRDAGSVTVPFTAGEDALVIVSAADPETNFRLTAWEEPEDPAPEVPLPVVPLFLLLVLFFTIALSWRIRHEASR